MQHQTKRSQQVSVNGVARDAVDVRASAPRFTVVASTDIGAPPGAVWNLYCDPHRYPELAHATERMLHVPDGPMGVGYRYKEIGVMGPFKTEDEWRVTEFEPMRRQVHVADDGTARSHLEIGLEPTPAGCRVTQRFGVEPRGTMKGVIAVLWPLFMRRLAQRAMDLTVANYKAAAEAPVARTRPGTERPSTLSAPTTYDP